VNPGDDFSNEDIRSLNTTPDYTFLPRPDWRERYENRHFD